MQHQAAIASALPEVGVLHIGVAPAPVAGVRSGHHAGEQPFAHEAAVRQLPAVGKHLHDRRVLPQSICRATPSVTGSAVNARSGAAFWLMQQVVTQRPLIVPPTQLCTATKADHALSLLGDTASLMLTVQLETVPVQMP